jgi:hypothetical protein
VLSDEICLGRSQAFCARDAADDDCSNLMQCLTESAASCSNIMRIVIAKLPAQRLKVNAALMPAKRVLTQISI